MTCFFLLTLTLFKFQMSTPQRSEVMARPNLKGVEEEGI
jgi:hypothetical protein